MTDHSPIPSRPGARRRSHAKTSVPASPATPAADGQGIEVVSALLSVAEVRHPAREQLIAEAAYHRAESRGFEPGRELDDWLSAETEVDARLRGEGRAY